MAYSDGEALILTQIVATASFDATNAVRGKWIVLTSGKANQYCILRMGPFTHEQYGLGGMYRHNWTTVAEVWTRLTDQYDTSMAAHYTGIQAILNRFEAYRKAADTTKTIQDVFVRSASDDEEMHNQRGPSWVKRSLFIEWKEEANVTLQE